MYISPAGPSITESTLHSKLLVIALAGLFGCCSLKERCMPMKRCIEVLCKAKRKNESGTRWCTPKQCFHLEVTLSELSAKERHFYCICCLSYILNLHMFLSRCEEKSKAGQEDTRERLRQIKRKSL